MHDIIQLLPDHVANQIAAGEVVQRPASVVKELLENAVDASATQVNLVVKDAGKSLIQIVDNGLGMSMTDARLAFERHATSKIKSADDLFNLHTKGFRGEALASIAAVAQVHLKTKTDTAEIGTEILIEASEVKSQQPCVTQKGTSIAVKNLFYNIPARRNFLKSNSVEQRHIIDEFERVALAHPQVGFSYIHNSTELFQLPASNLRQRIVGIMGTKSNEKLVPVEEQTDFVKLYGFIGKPEFAKKQRGEQFFFVNNRYIKSPYLHHAVCAAYDGLLKDKSIPSYFLYLEVDPQTIDINIHPTKTEIKFEDEHAIYNILKSVVKHSLGQFQLTPVLDFERDSDFDTSYQQHQQPIKNPTIEVDRNFNPFKNETRLSSVSRYDYASNQKYASWQSLYAAVDTETEEEEDIFTTHSPAVSALFSEENMPTQRACFQWQSKYLVTQHKHQLLVIDQHRAHVRILYEELMKRITLEPAPSQQLLFPLEMEFSPADFQVLTDLQEALHLIGFGFDRWENNEIIITGLPSQVTESEIGNMLEKLIADVKIGVPKNNFEQNHILAKSLAENMAIKTGRALSQEEQRDLLEQLLACKDPTKTPTHQAIFIQLSSNEIETKLH